MPAYTQLNASQAPREKNGQAQIERATAIGADELMQRAEWIFRERPRSLKAVRHAYRELCLDIFVKIERVA